MAHSLLWLGMEQDLWDCWGCMVFRLLISGWLLCLPWGADSMHSLSTSCLASGVYFLDQETDLHVERKSYFLEGQKEKRLC